MAGIRVIGSATQLLAYHGFVEYDKLIANIAQATELGAINVKDINEYSMRGGIYIDRNGSIATNFDKDAEREATYKVVPTGLTQKYSGKKLFASFFKCHGRWDGVYLGTASKIYTRYKEHYSGDDFCAEHERLFCEDETRDLIGFGIKSLLGETLEDIAKSAESTEETDESKIANLDKAIASAEKELKAGKKSKSNRIKLQNKINRMKSSRNELLNSINEKKATNELADNNVNIVDKAEESSQKTVKDNKVNAKSIDNKKTVEKEATSTHTENKHSMNTIASNETSTKEVTKAEIKSITSVEDSSYNDDYVEESNQEAKQRLKSQKIAKASEKKQDANIKDGVKQEESKPNTSLSISGHKLTTSAEDESPVFNANKFTQLKLVAEEIYDKLLVKEDWANEDYARLCFYIQSIIYYVQNKALANKDIEGVICSINNDKALINTNLIDNYGNFIYIIDHNYMSFDFNKKPITVMKSKSSLIDEGFDIKSIKILPEVLKFVESPSELIFDGDINDFDLEDEEHLNHIINERRYRFPDKYSNVSCKLICDKIRTSIEQAVKISKIDYRYVIPMYNIRLLEVEFLIPLHLDTHYGQTPELAIIVTNKNGLWKIFTILPTADACENARLISNIKDSWIS